MGLTVPGVAPAAGTSVASSHAGTTLGTSTYDTDTDTVTIDFESVWGIDGDGNAYYNADGAAPGEQAVIVVQPDGVLTIVKPRSA